MDETTCSSRQNNTDRELCQIITTSVTEIVRSSLNSTFRQTYFDTIQVSNSTDAQNNLENKLMTLLDVDGLFKKDCTGSKKKSLEHHIATKILHSSDAKNSRKLSDMKSLIKQLLDTDHGVNE